MQHKKQTRVPERFKDGYPQISSDQLDGAVIALKNNIEKAIQKHGAGVFASPYEGMGALFSEFNEYEREVHDRNYQRQCEELLDIATVALVEYCSLQYAR
jgi:hypothetical protein